MPNEIFNDLKTIHDKGSSHVAFAYSFYYLISWLYRYAKYGELDIDVKMIKEVLGYNADNKKVNYLIKKNGLLDEIGYTYTDNDYPIAWDFNDGDILFTMLSDMDDEVKKIMIKQKGRNFKIKVPVKAIWRNKESEEENIWDGTFYDISYTHEMLFDVFVKCMENEDLGVTGFYLYGYLKYRCQWFDGKFNRSIENIANDLGMSRNTADKYLTNLTKYGLINYQENENYMFYNEKIVREAHTYEIL